MIKIHDITSYETTYVDFDSSSTQTYITKRKEDLKEITKELSKDGTIITYGNGWVRINGKIYNGFTKEIIENTCKLANISI